MHSISVLVVLIAFSLAFALAMLIAGYIVAPKADNDTKNSTYECGMKLFSDARVLAHPRYLLYALMFLVFDAEIILLFPFALAFEKLEFFVFIQAVIFLFILLLSLGYVIQKNMLRFR